MNTRAVLAGDAGLTGIQSTLTGRPARRILRQALGEMLNQGWRMGSLRLSRAKYKPGKNLLAYYNVPVQPPSGSAARMIPVAAAWKPTEDLLISDGQRTQIEQMEIEARESGLMDPLIHLQHDLPAQGLRLQIWPLDPEFPQLVRLSDPGHIPDLLETAGLPAGSGPVQITPIRYRPGERHVLRYRIAPLENQPNRPGWIYAKLYQTPQSAVRAYKIANRVADYLAANVQGLYGVRPVGMSSPDAVILYPHADGIPLSRQLGRSPAWLARQYRHIGAALACLHQSSTALTEDLSENTLAREIKVVIRASEHLQVLLPDTGAQILRALDQIQTMSEQIPQELPTFTHSDFKADHLLISRAGIALIDFDTCALADPALDIGKFLADLDWWHNLSHTGDIEPAQQEFITGYFDTLPVMNPDRLARARLYHALILIKIAIRRTRLNWPTWKAVTTRLIDRAQALLDQPSASTSKP